ncbi:MAG TPA: deoxyguanosinetriphosphate triphosphohydrolase [Methylibium sp.]|nr:deoxyguanosinetriphosphate triphosphohydrolase [Methylibium sp.]
MALEHYASDPRASRGRRHAEPAAPTRDEFQRDRDRIVHCTAFRRLVYKTQVFLNHEGDLFRTRLTHSLEVAQLARSIARALGLNEDLTEAIALAHDLGHTPFGHAGQEALNSCLREAVPACGGFEHNLQSLRVVDRLEERYAAFDGLNLSFETREGILKHCSRRHAEALERAEPRGIAHRFLHGGQPGLEAQLCNLADEIAYNAHDIDDGVRSGLLEIEQLRELPLVARHLDEADRAHPGLAGRRRLFETLRRLLSAQVYDVIDASRAALREHCPADADAVRAGPPLIRFSAAMRAESTELKRFLFARLYRHPQVMESTRRAQRVVRELFQAYHQGAAELPPARSDLSRHRVAADHVAGMTDRYALREHRRLTGESVFEAMP